MKITFLVLFTVFNQLVIAQAGYKVVYEQKTPERTMVSPMTINGEHRTFILRARTNILTVVFNDSTGYLFTVSKKGATYNDHDSVFGNKVALNNLVYNLGTREVTYNGSSKGKKRPALWVDTFKSFRFEILEDSVIAYNQLCSKLQIVNEKNDSLLALVSKEIPAPFGPLGYMGLPGLVLELYHYKSGQHTTLKSIRPGNYIIQIPSRNFLDAARSGDNTSDAH